MPKSDIKLKKAFLKNKLELFDLCGFNEFFASKQSFLKIFIKKI